MELNLKEHLQKLVEEEWNYEIKAADGTTLIHIYGVGIYVYMGLSLEAFEPEGTEGYDLLLNNFQGV